MSERTPQQRLSDLIHSAISEHDVFSTIDHVTDSVFDALIANREVVLEAMEASEPVCVCGHPRNHHLRRGVDACWNGAPEGNRCPCELFQEREQTP